MNDPYGLHRATLPAAYPQLVLEIATERGLAADAILTAAELPLNLLEHPSGRITPWQYTLITVAAAHLLKDQGLGMEVGLRMRPTAHGFLGYALMSSTNLGEAMRLTLHFMRLRQRHIQMSFRSEGDDGVIRLREEHDFGPVRHFFIEGMLIGIARSAQFLLNDSSLLGELWLDYPEPDYFACYRDDLPQLRFDMPEVQIRFKTSDLSRPLRMADPIASRQAIEQCERELALAGQGDGLLLDVRAMLKDSIESPPSLDQVANSLFMSPRSLKRKLQADSASYQKLLDEVRYDEARRLLAQAGTGLQQIGANIGYDEPASFTRAFRKWSGMTPSQYRKTQV
ncbi:MAG: AraC-like DNA-binding protein [Gammaproteobacteria bacterium]|jgi:AraC-like DNA-binding protein